MFYLQQLGRKLVRKTWQLAWLGYLAVTICIIGFFLAYGLVTPLYIVGRVYPPANKWAAFVMKWGIWLLMAVQPWFSGKIDLEIPDGGPLLLISNHRSHLDVFILLAHIKALRIMSRKTLFSFPGIGPMMRISHQIPVASSGVSSIVEAMEIVRQKLKNGERVLIFPELTRCPPGYRGELNFTVAPFQIAHRENIKILPVFFKGTDDVWPKGQIGINFRKPVVAGTLPPVDPKNFASPKDLKDEVKRQIERALL